MLLHAEPQKSHFPSLILGEDSLVNRLRRKKALTQESKDDTFDAKTDLLRNKRMQAGRNWGRKNE